MSSFTSVSGKGPYAAARHPRLPASVRERLRRDGVLTVREAAEVAARAALALRVGRSAPPPEPFVSARKRAQVVSSTPRGAGSTDSAGTGSTTAPAPAPTPAPAANPEMLSLPAVLLPFGFEHDSALWATIAAHPDAPPSLLAWAACHSAYTARLAAAHDAATPPEAVRALYWDSNPTIAAAAANHPALPHTSRKNKLARLKKTGSPSVLQTLYSLLGEASPLPAGHADVVALAERAAFRQALLADLFATHLSTAPSSPDLTPLVLAAAASPSLQPLHAERAAVCPDWLVRYVIASNLATPASVLAALARDGLMPVRAAARATLERVSTSR